MSVDQQVHRDLMDLMEGRESKDHRVPLESVDPLDQKVVVARLATLENRARMVTQELWDQLDQQVLQAQLVQMERQAQEEALVRLD